MSFFKKLFGTSDAVLEKGVHSDPNYTFPIAKTEQQLIAPSYAEITACGIRREAIRCRRAERQT